MVAVLTFLQGFLGSKGGVGFTFVLGIAAAGGWISWYYEDEAHAQTRMDAAQRIGIMQTNVANMEAAVKTANDSVVAMQMAAVEDAADRKIMQHKYDLILNERDEAVSKLESYQGRWANASFKKPKTMGKLANRATDKRVHKFSTATCRAGCDSERDGGDNAAATAETGSDQEG